MAERTEINLVVQDSAGNALTSVSVTVKLRDSATLATVYLNSTGATTKSNPSDTTLGRIEGWLDPGAYDITVADTLGRFATYTERFEAISGNVLGVARSQLENGIIDASKIDASLKPSGSAATTTEALRAIGTGAGQVVSGTDARLSDARPPTDNSVTTAKLASSAVTGIKWANELRNVPRVAGTWSAGVVPGTIPTGAYGSPTWTSGPTGSGVYAFVEAPPITGLQRRWRICVAGFYDGVAGATSGIVSVRSVFQTSLEVSITMASPTADQIFSGIGAWVTNDSLMGSTGQGAMLFQAILNFTGTQPTAVLGSVVVQYSYT